MTRRVRRTVACVVATASVAAGGAGCGVPTETEVRVDGPVAEAEVSGSGVQSDPPPGPDDATDDRQLVDYFLQAAAADPADAVEKLRPFIHSEQRGSWRPDPRVMVVRVEDITRTPAGDDEVRFDLKLRRVGVLTDGAIEPQIQEPETVAFSVVRETAPVQDLGHEPMSGGGYRIVDPPRFVMLEDRALERYFLPRSLYFWDADYDVLVPDLRWLPRAVPAARRPQIILDWLLAGPSPWLDSVVGVADGVNQVGRAVPEEDTLVIELSAPTAELEHRALDAQFWWTLRPELASDMTLTLVIDGRPRQVVTSDWPPNLAAWEPPRSFAVVGGEVRAYPGDEATTELPALDHGVNSGVESAALSQGGRIGALVRADSDGLRLLLTGASGVTETELRGVGTMSRPVWLREPTGTGLVVADHRLYRFNVREEQVAEVPVPAFMAGQLTAVAAAPDGRRLALIAGGELYVAAMRRDGNLVGLHEPQMLPTTATDLAGVAFSRPDRLAVLGREDGRYWLYEITVDGGLEERLSFDLGAPQSLGNLVAYPGDPERESRRGLMMFEADGRAYAYRQAPEAIRAEEFGLEAAEEELPDPRAPFFLE